MEGMTIKQIAEIANVAESTVRNWIGSAKSAEITAKIAEARKTSIAAQFNLTETLAIIRAGHRFTLADLLEQNANNKTADHALLADEMKQFVKTLMVEMMPVMAAAIATAIKPIPIHPTSIAAMRQPHLSLPESTPSDDYYTIKGYGNIRGVKITKSVAISLGRDASRLSRMKNIEIRKSKDLEWGQVNAYHVTILQDIFTL
jgi:hypothetical protein